MTSRERVGWATVVCFALAALLALAAILRADVPAPLTDIEILRVENLKLRGLILQRELDDFQAARVKLKADIEAPRPGFLYDVESGKLVPKEPPK